MKLNETVEMESKNEEPFKRLGKKMKIYFPNG
jgi:hypothetical protein